MAMSCALPFPDLQIQAQHPFPAGEFYSPAGEGMFLLRREAMAHVCFPFLIDAVCGKSGTPVRVCTGVRFVPREEIAIHAFCPLH